MNGMNTSAPSTTTTLSSTTTNQSVLSSTTPFLPATTNSSGSAHNGSLVHQPLIFLQTAAAQGIGGAFAFLALIITVHQVKDYTVEPQLSGC